MAAGDIRAGGAVVEIGADDKGLRAGLARAAGRLEGFEKKLKDMFGPRSLLKDAAEIALGGGAVAGVTFAAQAIGDAADKVAALNAEFDSGQLSASEYAGEIARSIPVLGQMVTMFDKIGAAITGSGAELAKLTAENEKAAKAWKIYDEAVAGANRRMLQFNGDRAPESVESINASIAELKRNGVIAPTMIKDLTRRRNKLAILEMEALTNPMTLANEQANAQRQAQTDSGRMNRNAINADLRRTNQEIARGVQGAADEFARSLTEAIVKSVPEAAQRIQRRNLEAQLAGIRGSILSKSAGSMSISSMVDPRSFGDSPEVRQLKATEKKIIEAIEGLVAN